MNTQDKLGALARIARALNAAGVRWALGASLMLHLRGVAREFHDIDLLTAESDASAADGILASLGERKPARTGAGFRTKFFRKYAIDGVDVDLMAGFAIVCDGAEHPFPLEADGGIETIDVLGEAVPLQSLSFWRTCYHLMGRDNRVEMIDRWQRGRAEPLRRWAMEIQSIAQCGLAYVRDPYDAERYARLRALAAEMMAFQTGLPAERIETLFCNERGYQTPKIDTRAALFREDKILLVRERDGRWALPGGWCDVLESVASNAVKEVREEAGLIARVERVIAIQDRNRHNLPVYAYGVCKVFLLCREEGGAFQENIETTGFDCFSLDELPPLAEEKCNREQIEMCFRARADENWRVQFD